MMRAQLPLNALRAFEAAARHLSFTLAADELCVTQAAVSQQVRQLEARLGCTLFKRLPRALALTDEGLALLPVLADAFGRIEQVLQQFDAGHFHAVLSVGVVGTFAIGWLMPRLTQFQAAHPYVSLRLLTHNNLVDPAAEGLDYAIRYGDGNWPATHNTLLLDAPLAPLCAPAIAARLQHPADLAGETLLRSYRSDDWPQWLALAGQPTRALHGPVFDSSRLMVEAALQGAGVALAPPAMFARELADGSLQQPFSPVLPAGGYWLCAPRTRPATPAMQAFAGWVIGAARET
ncbi:transcriptional regulator, LysR family [Andreprevotia lacus DSM 23236]|jgi:LysR family transcriptional regulator of beta-lactamase|uniref:Transcriptional regulator, LysR family n=1 Tax=Andreprevotia lacus DSM 23236 TaxID=1121001 RepID=A0A1W1XZZ7_9NEIS|nr:LysR family transcriptional regulator [Andreprevotia lacus]SMC29445.1 transcriptional regulator, LysR family [Andreprevotia lacus DSM 23236]